MTLSYAHRMPMSFMVQMYDGARAAAMQTPTKRQKLRHALACQRLGLDAPDNALLEIERPVPPEDAVADSEPSLPIFACLSCASILSLLHSDRGAFPSIAGNASECVRQMLRAQWLS